MALIRNGSHQINGLNRVFGAVGAYGLRGNFDRNGAFKAFDSGQHAVSNVTNRNSIPAGARHPLAWKPPTKAGGLASHNNAKGSATVSLSLASGRNISGTAAGTSTATSTAQLVVSLSGTATGTSTVTGNLQAALGMSGSASGSSTASSTIGAIAWMSGSASGSSTASLTSYAIGHLSGSITPFTELSPQSLAAAVWSALAAQSNDAGTMGELLNSAGAAADPLLGVVEGTLTLRDVQRIVLAVLAGKVTGAGTGTETFKGQGGENRVVSTVDASGNRSNVDLDAT